MDVGQPFAGRLTGIEDQAGCWEWTGHRDHKGYGRLTFRGRTIRAYRLAYELFVGPIPKGACVLHRCDNPPCCNPAHLFLGSRADNHADMMAKGRHGATRGSAHHKAKLTEDDVAVIRAEYAAAPSRYGLRLRLARQYGVHPETIRNAAQGRFWKGVDAEAVAPGNPREIVNCQTCGKEVIAVPSVPRRYCSLPCFHRRNAH